MKFLNFIKEKIVSILLLIFSLLTIEIFFMIYPFATFIKIYTPIVILLAYLLGLLYEYFIKKKYYENLISTLNKLEDKYLIAEIINAPSFIEGKILHNVVEETNKSMHENVNKFKYLQEDYKEYIELWIHEVKIPIATSKMVIENNKSKATKSIYEELDKVENYIEQALFYARSNTVEKDYYIKKCRLREIVNESIKKNKTTLIQEKIEIDTHDLDTVVNTDSKWLVFILNQIIQNSVKYRNKDIISKIEIYSVSKSEKVILYIKDNGIGIKKSELSKVFDKGFTGTNGRLSGKKSTGIGLYLCKKLCDKLSISIEIHSIEGKETEIKIVFPKGSYTNLI